MDGVILIAVLALTGGAIAYIGDRLGTRIGKRKLTVFGLRPRHTSTLITIVSGFFIVAATMGTLTIVSKDVRTALFGMEKLKAELNSLGNEILLKNQELEKNQRELQAKTAEYEALLVKIEETGARLKAVGLELGEVQRQRDAIEAQLALAQKEYQASLEALQTAKAELDRKVEELTAMRNELQDDVARLQKTTENLRQGIRTVREGTIVFRSGELLNSVVLESALDQKAQENDLRKMLDDANRNLLQRFEIDKPDFEMLMLQQADFEKALRLLQERKGTYVVRVVAAGNIIYGEPVIAGIEVYANRLIYRSGEEIYSQVINVGLQEEDSSQVLLFFLRQVNNTAIRQGVLPEPLRGTVGVMGGMEFYDTAAKIRQAAGGGKVRVTALAQDDVHTAGPLRLKFKIERVY